MDLYQRELDSDPPELLKFAMDDISKLPFEERNRPMPSGALTRPNNPYVFIGRGSELEKMEKEYSAGTFLLIKGEIGSGKTRLVQQFYNLLPEKPRLLHTACQEEDANLPLQPLIRLIRNEITREDLEHLDSRWLKPLSILVPEIVRKTSFTPTETEISSQEGRMELLEALYHLFLSN
jgi:hypothetical protein